MLSWLTRKVVDESESVSTAVHEFSQNLTVSTAMHECRRNLSNKKCDDKIDVCCSSLKLIGCYCCRSTAMTSDDKWETCDDAKTSVKETMVDQEANKQAVNVCSNNSAPQASSGSSGNVIGEVDVGEIIQDSDSEVITVGEGMRYGCSGTKSVKQEARDSNVSDCTKTSTPAIGSKGKLSFNGKKKRVGRYIKKARKDRLKRKLDEAARTELSSTGSDLDSKKSDEECNKISTENGISFEFDTLSSGTAEQLNVVLDEYELNGSGINNNESVWCDSSDPSLDGCIIWLVDSSKLY